MKRYAFIDVPNTTGTTRECLHFFIDWKKLYDLLVNDKWTCDKVFFYKGYKGEKEKEQLERIKNMGYIVQTKLTHVHKDKEENITINCPCGISSNYKNIKKGNQKSNCDVELTVDIINTVVKGDEAIIFTGDGDFAYLVEDLISKGIKVLIVSSPNKDAKGNKRLSTRLMSIIHKEDNGLRRCRLIHINNWKMLIKSDQLK